MLIFDNNNNTVILDNIYSPTNVENIWVLDFSIMDFTLTPLLVLEELVCPALELQIQGFRFIVPTSWNILVMDLETSQLDIVEMSEIVGKEFNALIHGPNQRMIESAVVSATNYIANYTHVGPSLNKHQMLCYPISNSTWVNISPSDPYNKYLKNKVAGDII